ncbi:hypothetical protein BH10BAC5_BH10BAC5_12300 [soil metagenome]
MALRKLKAGEKQDKGAPKKKHKDPKISENGYVDDDAYSHEDEDNDVTETDLDEDDPNLISEIKKFEKTHKHPKVIKVFDKIKNPSYSKVGEIKKDDLEKEFKRLIQLLDRVKIFVEFHNEYPILEKYRFLTEEVFAFDFEESKKGTTFFYEEYHPEMDEAEDDEFQELY